MKNLSDRPRVPVNSKIGDAPVTKEKALATCAIRVYSQQHGSIQGFIRVDKSKVAFRSGLKLMSMLHELLSERVSGQE